MRKGRSVALRRLRYVAMLSLFVAAYVLPGAVAAASGSYAKYQPCDASNADRQCPPNQRCLQKKIYETTEAVCDCMQGYEWFDKIGGCAPSASMMPVDVTTVRSDQVEESGGGSVAAGLLIPTFLIIIGVVLYFGARRYRWLQRFRQYRQNRYGNVLVTRDDDDDDDPPIA
ncbi:hypothetical protein KPH14_001825 [Odynerus spinipes]|uniref:Uncharacterized protein n=1 Tax=Odynerus spinipes TaxID=1348599 RepID=A0AAD9RZU7_9HYME|nr:hypothetical protein KPH14_001825 [Odynerus spinipes]